VYLSDDQVYDATTAFVLTVSNLLTDVYSLIWQSWNIVVQSITSNDAEITWNYQILFNLTEGNTVSVADDIVNRMMVSSHGEFVHSLIQDDQKYLFTNVYNTSMKFEQYYLRNIALRGDARVRRALSSRDYITEIFLPVRQVMLMMPLL
jgi:hypothetical protein